MLALRAAALLFHAGWPVAQRTRPSAASGLRLQAELLRTPLMALARFVRALIGLWSMPHTGPAVLASAVSPPIRPAHIGLPLHHAAPLQAVLVAAGRCRRLETRRLLALEGPFAGMGGKSACSAQCSRCRYAG